MATTRELLKVMTRDQFDWQVRRGGLLRVWHGVYAAETLDLRGRLAALDLFVEQEVVACMGTAAALYGSDVENTAAVHVLDPGSRLRPKVGLVVRRCSRSGVRRSTCDKRSTSRVAGAASWPYGSC